MNHVSTIRAVLAGLGLAASLAVGCNGSSTPSSNATKPDASSAATSPGTTSTSPHIPVTPKD